ncbi:MAG: biotin/lipoyl-binding protein [Lachnospiraceae bacterium]|nr:biotin/lipoyl-binding protein [Lachnospiraceae bacterium]
MEEDDLLRRLSTFILRIKNSGERYDQKDRRMIRMMKKLRKYIMTQLTREPEAAKRTLQETAKRLLIGFFVLMLLLTAVSRAADTVTVARVKAAKVKRSVLNYVVTGEGTIKAEGEKYLWLYEGARISEILVKEGQPVKEGELLFVYDIQELEVILENLQRELTIAELNLERELLTHEPAPAAEDAQSASRSLKRAELDAKLAQLQLETEKSKIDKAKQEELEAAAEAYLELKEATLGLEEDKEWEINQARKDADRAEEALEELFADKKSAEAVILEYKTAVQNSKVKITVPSPEKGDAVLDHGSIVLDGWEDGAALMNLYNRFNEMPLQLDTQPESLIMDRIDPAAAKAGDEDPLTLAQLHIFLHYYGEQPYKKHLKEIKALLKDLNRAREDYLLAFMTEAETGGFLTTSQKAAYIRAYQDAYEAWMEATEKDRKLCNAITAYGAAIQGDTETVTAEAYEELFSLLYQEDKEKQQAIRSAKELAVSKQEDLKRITLQWERKLSASDKELEKARERESRAQEIYDQIKEKSYNYSEDAQIQENQQGIADRNLEDANEAFEKAKNKDAEIERSNQRKAESDQISGKLLSLEVEKKKEAVDLVEKLLDQEGRVLSPVSGNIRQIDLTVGSKISGAEKVSITMENYGFITQVSRDEVKHLEAGDEINIMLNNNKKTVSAIIESVSPEDEKGMSEITAVLPEGEYNGGSHASFTVNKTSKQYMQTLPLQAVRMDSNQVNYILAIRESNTSLGKELIAYRVNVEVLEKDSRTAAVKAVIDAEDKIIISSSKSIEEGDRVRIDEENK